jgi:formylglycine-generating enzyme required for sulfatase activity
MEIYYPFEPPKYTLNCDEHSWHNQKEQYTLRLRQSLPIGLHTLWSLLSLGQIELAKTFKATLYSRGWGETEWPLRETIETLWAQGRYLEVADTISNALSAGVTSLHVVNCDLVLLGFEFTEGALRLHKNLKYCLPRVLTATSAESLCISHLFEPITRLLTLREELQTIRMCLPVENCSSIAFYKFKRCREDREWFSGYRETLSQHVQQLGINLSDEQWREGEAVLSEALQYCDMGPSSKEFPELNTTLFSEICNAYEKCDLVKLRSITESARMVFSTVTGNHSFCDEYISKSKQEELNLKKQNALKWIRNLNQVQHAAEQISNWFMNSYYYDLANLFSEKTSDPDDLRLYCDAQAARMERHISQIEQEICSLKTRNKLGSPVPLATSLEQGSNPAGEFANKEVFEQSDECKRQETRASTTLQLNHSALTASTSICQLIQRRFDLLNEIFKENVIESRAAFNPGQLVAGTAHSFGDIECAWCPAGTFVMGSPTTENNRRSDEEQHLVTLSKGFWMACGQTTQSEYVKIIGHNPSGYLTNIMNRPVEQVTWNEAVEYCLKLTNLHQSSGIIPQGWKWRLPTEAEWEYAARAGTTGATHGELNAIAWNQSSRADLDGPMPVKLLAPNAWGLHDMIGNVYEWCLDIYGEYPISQIVDPQGPTSGATRVYRGGSWCFIGDDQIEDLRSAARCAWEPDYRDSLYQIGFRPVLSPTN